MLSLPIHGALVVRSDEIWFAVNMHFLCVINIAVLNDQRKKSYGHQIGPKSCKAYVIVYPDKTHLVLILEVQQAKQTESGVSIS